MRCVRIRKVTEYRSTHTRTHSQREKNPTKQRKKAAAAAAVTSNRNNNNSNNGIEKQNVCRGSYANFCDVHTHSKIERYASAFFCCYCCCFLSLFNKRNLRALGFIWCCVFCPGLVKMRARDNGSDTHTGRVLFIITIIMHTHQTKRNDRNVHGIFS